MNQRPPVYDPNSRRPPNIIGKIAIGVCLAAGLVFVAFVIAMVIALNSTSYGSAK